MPTLKKLTCCVEWSDSGPPLQEHNTSYVDGLVKTYIAVPPEPTPFSIRLRSNGYIAPGLAMFVYMDGIYQCNRNRHNLKIPDGTLSRRKTEVNFHVRQKEEVMRDGTFRAKQWRFQKLEFGPNFSELSNIHVPHGAEYVGTIEVVVLRCLSAETSNAIIPQYQPTEAKTSVQALNSNKFDWLDPRSTLRQPSDDDSWSSSNSASAVGGMLDGACDFAIMPTGSMAFGGDMAWDDPPPNQDQTQQWRSGSRISNRGPDRSLSRGSGSNTSKEGPQHSDTRDRSQDRSGQDWGPFRSETKRSHNSPDPQGNAEQNSSSAKSKTLSSVVPRHSPAGSAVNQNSSNGSATADAPVVVININHGPRPRRETTWTETLDVENVNDVSWHNVGQDDNSQSQRSEKRSSNGSVDHEGSKKSNYDEGDWEAQPAYGGNGGDTDYSRLDNWETEQPTIPGGWDASNEQHQENNTSWDDDQSNNATTRQAGNERSQDNSNNWNIHENHKSGWDVQKKNDANTWENSDTHGQASDGYGGNAQDNRSAPVWNFSTQQNQGQNQQWRPKENDNVAQDNWTGESRWNGRGSNGNSPDNNQGPAAQSWGGKDKDNSWPGSAQPDARTTGAAQGFGNVQSKSKFSGAGSQEKSGPLFHFTEDPNQVNKPSPPHPSRKQPSLQAAWVESGATVPSKSPHQSSHLATHDGPNAPQMGSFGNVGLEMSESDAFQPKPKPYWSSWKQPKAEDNQPKPFAPAFASVEPLCKVPSEVAQRNNTTHQVHVGQLIPYAHRKASPKYMDSHDDPYAVFVFKYRSRAILEQMLNTKLTETEAERRLRMQGMSKDELIEEMLKAQANNTSQGSSGSESSSPSSKSGGSKNTVKASNKTYDPNRHAADGVNLGAVNQQLSQLQMHGRNGSDKGSTHPDVRWGRDTQRVQNSNRSWEGVPTASNHERVTGWLGSDHGVGSGGAGLQHEGNGSGRIEIGYPSGSSSENPNNADNMRPSTQHAGLWDWNVQGNGNGNGNGNRNWDGTANWTGQDRTGQQGEGGGNGNGNWQGDNNTGGGGGAVEGTKW